MIIALQQPYFLPYLGYFALIKHTTHWIVFDTPQFIRQGWIQRNRILKPVEGWQYIGVPIEKHSRDIAIKDIKIRQTEKWGEKILAQLEHYKKKAPYYSETIKLVEKIVLNNTDSIVEMNVNALSLVCNYLNIDFSYQIYSESDFRVDRVNNPDEWALETCKILGAKIYYNLSGGIEFYDSEKYKQNGIELYFLKLNINEYNQKRSTFEPALSIVDVLMFNDVEQIKDYLNDYEFV